MAQILKFFDAEHEYVVGDKKIPAVSEILRFLSREMYSSISQYTLDNAADRGKRVHKACEVLDKYGEAEIDKDIEPYIKAYIQFRKDIAPEWTRIEYACYVDNDDLTAAGTLDRYGKVKGGQAIVDLKPTATVHKPYVGAQLNGYKLIAEANGLKVDALYCLHLRKDGTYKLIEMPIDDTIFRACYAIHKIFEKKERTKK